jgi:DNA-binding transcriptional ArsR family regulator
MSQSLTGATNASTRDDADADRRVRPDEQEPILTAFNDDDCRRILEAVSDGDPLSAAELSERCDVPLSTTYRKLELLTEAGLLDERLRICRSGRHTSEYAQHVDDVQISVGGAGGLAIELS